jgi:hypothetical protein
MAEMGPGLLRTGVLLSCTDLLGFLIERHEEFRQGYSATLDNKPIDIGNLRHEERLGGENQVFFSVSS